MRPGLGPAAPLGEVKRAPAPRTKWDRFWSTPHAVCSEPHALWEGARQGEGEGARKGKGGGGSPPRTFSAENKNEFSHRNTDH